MKLFSQKIQNCSACMRSSTILLKPESLTCRRIPNLRPKHFLEHFKIRLSIHRNCFSLCIDKPMDFEHFSTHKACPTHYFLPMKPLRGHRNTVEPVYNGHPRDWTKLAVIHRWPLYTGDCLNPQKVST